MKRVVLLISIFALFTGCAGAGIDSAEDNLHLIIDQDKSRKETTEEKITIMEEITASEEYEKLKAATIRGYFTYWEMLGTISGIIDNDEDGMRWLSGGIYWNYYTNPDGIDYNKAEEIAKRMESNELPNNLFFLIEDEYDLDPREIFMETEIFKASWGNQLLARNITKVQLLDSEENLNIIRVDEPSYLKELGEINNTYGFGADLFSYEQHLDMFNTEGLYFYLAEYDGLPVGMSMAQDGDDFVSIPWVHIIDGYNIDEYLINAAEYDAFLRGKTICVMDTGLNAMLSDLGYEKYARTVQIVLE